MLTTISVGTSKSTEMANITEEVRKLVAGAGVEEGYCLVFSPHTTAGITVNEQADPTVVEDMLQVLNKMVPWEDNYRHLEGNSAAHVKASLVGPSQMIPISKGKLMLGTWQGIFFCEFDGPRSRKVHAQVVNTQS